MKLARARGSLPPNPLSVWCCAVQNAGVQAMEVCVARSARRLCGRARRDECGRMHVRERLKRRLLVRHQPTSALAGVL